MIRFTLPEIASSLFLLLMLGCSSGQQQWEVSAENKSDAPCSFFVTLGPNGGSTANVENVKKGEVIPLIAGNLDTVVQTVKVVRGTEEQSLTPKINLPTGRRYAIVLDAQGKLSGSMMER
jgi:hypothetical protein